MVRIICDKPGCPTPPVSYDADAHEVEPLIPEGWSQDIVSGTEVLLCPDCAFAIREMRDRYFHDCDIAVKLWFNRRSSA